MVLDQTICVVGAGLIICIGVTTRTNEWVSYLVIAGIGVGMSMQLPYAAVQLVLRKIARHQ